MLTAVSPKSRNITSVTREQDRLVLGSDHGTLILEPRTGNIIRVIRRASEISDTQDGTQDVSPVKPGVINTETTGEWSFTEDKDRVELELADLSLRIGKDTGSVSFYNKDGKLVFREREEDPAEFEEFDMFRLSEDCRKTKIVETADGQKEVLDEPDKVFAGHSYHIRFNFEAGDEAFYGLGQQEQGFASLRGHRVYLHQGNRKIAIPMLVSTGGYGILTDAYSPMIFNDDENGTYLYIEAAKELDYYLIAGDMNTVVSGYRELTGKASLLPKWAFGYIQSQERYETQEEIMDTAERFRREGIGLDCLVLDWLSWPDGQWGQKSYDESRFPDPQRMIDKLHEDHVHFMISLWPTMAHDTPDHREFAEKDLFLPACTVYDAFKHEARALYFDQLNRRHFSYGTDAWWCDSSEPFTPEWSHRMRMEEGDLYRAFCEEAGLRMPYEYCNSFPLYHAMGIYENQRRAMEEPGFSGTQKRVCNLTRSAYTGQQRYGTVMWSGDTAASWKTLRDQIATGLHFSASGLPYWTMDIGAFFVKHGEYWYWNGRYDDTFDNKGYCELYVRWYQFGAFLPVFRAHGTDCRREPWNLKGEFYEALVKANRLRYSLMPYIYSEAGKVWLKDCSLIRWLAFDFAEDRQTWEIADQYMFGESIMVCPITSPMYYDESGAPLDAMEKTRTVYFPAGCGWYDFYTGVRYEGGTKADVKVTLDEIPVYVREGSLIPVCEPALSTEEQTGEITWKRFGEGEISYELYEDAGDGYGYEQGEFTVRKVRLSSDCEE